MIKRLNALVTTWVLVEKPLWHAISLFYDAITRGGFQRLVDLPTVRMTEMLFTWMSLHIMQLFTAFCWLCIKCDGHDYRVYCNTVWSGEMQRFTFSEQSNRLQWESKGVWLQEGGRSNGCHLHSSNPVNAVSDRDEALLFMSSSWISDMVSTFRGETWSRLIFWLVWA